jgi:hypothetical protein
LRRVLTLTDFHLYSASIVHAAANWNAHLPGGRISYHLVSGRIKKRRCVTFESEL